MDPDSRRQVTEVARIRLDEGGGHEQVLEELRRRGLDKLESILVLRDASGLPAGEVRHIVHFSATWDAEDYLYAAWQVREHTTPPA
jgi:hypothetical protein